MKKYDKKVKENVEYYEFATSDEANEFFGFTQLNGRISKREFDYMGERRFTYNGVKTWVKIVK